jgi:hypothetical protein
MGCPYVRLLLIMVPYNVLLLWRLRLASKYSISCEYMMLRSMCIVRVRSSSMNVVRGYHMCMSKMATKDICCDSAQMIVFLHKQIK